MHGEPANPTLEQLHYRRIFEPGRENAVVADRHECRRPHFSKLHQIRRNTMNHTLTSEFATRTDDRRRFQAWIDKVDQFARTIDAWKRRQHTRRQLAAADYHILRDIGISEAERDIEVNKYFWEE
jgi:uncharacterized protein YjiS (DUF1127 family)